MPTIWDTLLYIILIVSFLSKLYTVKCIALIKEPNYLNQTNGISLFLNSNITIFLKNVSSYISLKNSRTPWLQDFSFFFSKYRPTMKYKVWAVPRHSHSQYSVFLCTASHREVVSYMFNVFDMMRIRNRSRRS